MVRRQSSFPLLMAAPRFFAGEMQLGGLMQTVGAFGAVQGALSYLDYKLHDDSQMARCDRPSGRLFQNNRMNCKAPNR